MGCFYSSAKEDEDKFSASVDGWTDFTEQRRHSTDALCLLFIIASWIAMTMVGFVAIGIIPSPDLKAGSPSRLIMPVDYQGRTCGYGSILANKPCGFYLASGAVVCVSSCPSKNDFHKFICFDDVQEAADSSETIAWININKGMCMYHVKSKPGKIG